MGRQNLVILFISLFVIQIFAAPTDSSELSLVVSSTEKSNDKASNGEGDLGGVPKIYHMHVKSDISNRFSHTTIISKVKNIAAKAQEARFAVDLPETAFITGFIMEVDGKNYTAHIKEKEEAKKTYDQAVASGLGAAHVAVSARDSNRFSVSVNIEPETKAAFYLSYEQLLLRRDGHYEQVINLHPGQPVQDLSVEVAIAESRKITDLKAPPVRSGNEIGNDNTELDPRADVEVINETSAIVRFSPNIERQKQIAHLLGTKEEEGLAGQFIVQYDVERDPKGGEVLVNDGYFVHFFAPSELAALPKHVVFVLDISGSMDSQKMEQLKEAMHKILEQLNENDLFNLVEFNTNVKVWDLDDAASSVWFPIENIGGPCIWKVQQEKEEVSFANFRFPFAYAANAEYIKKAKDTISKLVATGATDINTALRVGLHLAELGKKQNAGSISREPIIILLTDGEPTVRVTSTEEIFNKITNLNNGLRKSSIFALSFGDGADRKFLQKLALRNYGFSKHIYEAADAALQLQHFYKQISSPLLANVAFKYEPSIKTVTKTEFPVHFGGSELVVAGFCGTLDIKQPLVEGWGVHGSTLLEPVVHQSVSGIERLWAYLTVKQLLEKRETLDVKEKDALKAKVTELALKYSFVTPLTSLVVVKPSGTSDVQTEAAVGKKNIFAGGAQFIAHKTVAFATTPAQRPTFTPSAMPELSGLPGYPTRPPPVISTTPSCPELSTPTTEAPSILAFLPWLNDILNQHGVLNIAPGKYKLGLNETLSDVVTCLKTPLGNSGHCKLLQACPKVHHLLTSSDVFVQHFCVLKHEFAGVCCPDES